MNAKKLRSLIVPGLMTLALGFLTATAADDMEAKPKKGPTKAEIKKYDANGDGQLDEAEMAKMKSDDDAKKAAEKKARLDKYDTNKDGKVSGEEKVAEDNDKAVAKAEREAKKAAKDAAKK